MTSRRTSVAPQRKSSKPSAAKRKRPSPTFYTDECLGRRVADALRQAGHDVQCGVDQFPGVDDKVWLPQIGERQWVLLTKDMKIRRRPLEVEAIVNSGVRAFVITATDMPHSELIGVVLKAMRRIERICHRPGPFVFNITRMGLLSEIPTRELRRRARRR